MILSLYRKQYTDEEIVAMLQSGHTLQENKAINYLIALHEGKLTTYIKKKIPPHRESDPIFWSVMTTFFEQAKKKFVVQKEDAILRFLYKVAENRCKKEQVIRRLDDLEKWKPENIEPDVVRKLGDEALQHFFQTVINLLPTRCQETIRMYYYKGMRHNDIAENLDISAQGSKNTLHRCMNKLKSMIKGGNFDEVLFQ